MTELNRVAREMGSAAAAMSIASLCLNPFDVVKTKIQTQCQLVHGNAATPKLYTGVGHCLRSLYAEQGFVRGLWLPGLTASVVRDIINGGIRMGLYPAVARGINESLCGTGAPGLGVKIMAGLVTGAVGSFAGSPTDLVKVRLQAEAGRLEGGVYTTGLYKGAKQSYRGTFHALVHITQNEGWRGLFRGWSANITRAALVTSAQMSSYDQTKVLLAPVLENEKARVFVSSFVSGITAASFAAPADLVRSRVMDDSRAGKGTAAYSGSLDCVLKTVRNEGPFALWKGFVPAYLRLGPQFMLSLPLMEFLRTHVFALPSL